MTILYFLLTNCSESFLSRIPLAQPSWRTSRRRRLNVIGLSLFFFFLSLWPYSRLSLCCDIIRPSSWNNVRFSASAPSKSPEDEARVLVVLSFSFLIASFVILKDPWDTFWTGRYIYSFLFLLTREALFFLFFLLTLSKNTLYLGFVQQNLSPLFSIAQRQLSDSFHRFGPTET